MKLNKTKNFILNSYSCNILNCKTLLATIALMFTMITMLIILSACNITSLLEVPSDTIETPKEPSASEEDSQIRLDGSEPVDIATEKNIREECLKVAEQYKSIYLNSTKEPSPYSEKDLYISGEDYKKIVTLLDSQGNAVAYPNWDETETLLNPQDFHAFWKKVLLGENTSFTVYTITNSGGLIYYSYELKDGQKLRVDAYMEWKENGVPEVISVNSEQISFWDYTEKGNFLYKTVHALPWKSQARGLLRIESGDEKLLNYGEKYIGIVGYDTHNLFLTDWSESDFGTLNFNDLFDNLYRGSNNVYFYSDKYEFDLNESCYYIPTHIFEPIILQYFNISQKHLRSQALYSADYQGYPWVESRTEHSNYFGYMRADVQNYVDNGDGTATMQVDVLCTESETDLLFTHELTVRNQPNGEFQFVSNKITFLDEDTFPQYRPRIKG